VFARKLRIIRRGLPMAQIPPDDRHSKAYKTLHEAIMNRDARTSAKNDEHVGPILKKLSNRDLDRLKSIAQNQQVSPTCNPDPPSGADA
jgi:hypothetical protein